MDLNKFCGSFLDPVLFLLLVNTLSVNAGEHVFNGTFENVTAQFNLTTNQDSLSGQPGLYSGETIQIDLEVDIPSNVSLLAVELTFTEYVFMSSNGSVEFPHERFYSQEGFLNQLSFNNTSVQPHSIRYDLGNVILGDGRNFFTLSWNYNLTSVFSDEVGNFDLSIRLFDAARPTTPFLELSSSVLYLGADLSAVLISPSNEVEGGDSPFILVYIFPSGTSNDDATDLQVVLGIERTFQVNSAQYYIGPSFEANRAVSVDYTALSTTGLNGLTINSTHPLYVALRGVVSDTVELNYFIPIYTTLKYLDGNRTEPQITKDLTLPSLTTKAPVVTLTSFDITPVLGFNHQANLEISILMGKGRLSKLDVKIAGSTAVLSPDFQIVSNVRQISKPTQILATDVVSLSRKKRAVVSSTTILGTFTNPSTSPATTPIIIKMSFNVNPLTSDPPGSVAMDLRGRLTSQVYGTSTQLFTRSVTFIKSLTLTKTVTMIDDEADPNVVLFTVNVEQPSWLTVYNLVLRDDSLPGMQASRSDQWFRQRGPAGSSLEITNSVRNFRYTVPQLPAGENVTLQYSASIISDEDDPNKYDPNLELVYYQAAVTFYTYDNGGNPYPSGAEIELFGYACLKRIYAEETSIIYEQGFAALSFFIALLVGALVAALIIFIIIRVCKKNIIGSVTSHSPVDNMVKDKGNRLLVDSSYMKKGGNTITDLSMVGVSDSIVAVLALKDKLQMYREIDNLDIVNTITVDKELEAERNEAMIDASTLLIRGLRVNGDITKDVEDKAVGTFRTNVRNLDKKLEEEYKLDLNVIYKDISIKNKNKLGELIKRQCEDKRRVVEETAAMEEKDRRELMAMLDQQHESEQNEVTYRLKLEQDELTERLRKEFSVRKRMGLKELQQQLMDDTISQGRLVQQQADWLIKEHKKNQGAIDKLYDEEISRQRMSLEEKLARRRALAHAGDSQEDEESDILNTMAGHQIETIKDMKKKRVLSAAEAERYVEKLQADMVNLKTSMDAERAKQERELHQRLSLLKARKLAELGKQQDDERTAFNKKSQEQQTDGPIDPVSFIQARQQKMSELRQERDGLDHELDIEHAGELENLRKKLSHQTETEIQGLEDKTLGELKSQHGLDEDQVRKILKSHERDLERLKSSQQAEREVQRQKLQEKLMKNRQEALQRQEDERAEQQQLREHETNLVQKLLNNQMSMSEEERDRIMKEHEKQMVKLENSLTLNKLRQKKMLEEKIAERRSRTMEKLEMKQDREYTKLRRTQENNGEESDEEGLKVQLAMMKRHTEQRLAVIQGQRMDIDQELEGIRVEMMRERAVALKEQEERLGAMLATLQMEKARELAKIEQQQAAINNLKLNLMDDLTDRGVLSNPECQRVIDVHKQEQDRLQKRLESQRIKQEKVLRQRLEERLQQREQLIGQMQEKEVQSASRSLPNKTSIKVKKVLMMSKHLVESEKFRAQMERERDQTLESLRQQYDMMRLKAMQEQELQFISGLIRLGQFKKSELANVVKLLFPGRSPDETNRLLQIMCEHAQIEKKDSIKDDVSFQSEANTSRLEERIKAATLASTLNSSQPLSSKGSMKSTGKRSGKLKNRRPQLVDEMEEDEYDLNTSYKSMSRPEPLGQDENTGYVEASVSFDDETFLNKRRLPDLPQGSLPPLDTRPKRKKKKSALRKLADRNVRLQDDYGDEYSV